MIQHHPELGRLSINTFSTVRTLALEHLVRPWAEQLLVASKQQTLFEMSATKIVPGQQCSTGDSGADMAVAAGLTKAAEEIRVVLSKLQSSLSC